MRILFFVVFITLTVFASEKSVLLLHSYNRGLIWSDDISTGVENILSKYDDIELTTEYMDGKKNDSISYKILTYDLFAKKLMNRKYDIVIASDNFAVNFILKYKKELFNDTSIIFCGLDKDYPGVDINELLDNNISIVLENKQVSTNINLILQVLPNTKHLYIISDTSPSSLLVNNKISNTILKYKDILKIDLNTSVDLDKIRDDIKKLPKESAILLGSVFKDSDGDFVSNYKIKEFINDSVIPVFSLMDYNLSEGIVGGLLTRGIYQGKESAKIALNILNNNKIDYKTPIITRADLVYDYKILEKFKINIENIPLNANLINKPQTFFEKYRVYVDRVFLIFPFILIFLVIAILNINKRRIAEKRLIAQSYLEQVLLNNIYSAIFWINNEGNIIGCNSSFCDFISLYDCKEECNNKDCSKKNFSKCNIIGENIDVIFEKSNINIKKNELFAQKNLEINITNNTYQVKSKSYMDENGKDNGIVTIITDVSEKKQLEINKQFIIQQSKLSEVGEMLSSIVHQWKAPLVELSAVAHKMQFYQKKKKLKEKDINDFFEIIMKQIIYMSNTIDDFRSFIKPSSKPSSFNIDMGIKEIISIVSFSLKYNNIKIDFSNNIDKEKDLFGYPNEFKQVILNIINNAKDSILEARKLNVCEGCINVILKESSSSYIISIHDDGLGIKEELEDKIFDSYFSTKSKGDGIGLYMAKLIIENKMKGEIFATNQVSGAKFTIVLSKNINNEMT